MGENFRLRLKEMHPGVADMDAVYEFFCEYGGRVIENCGNPLFYLYTDDSDIKINGNEVIVPYFVRQEGREVTVHAELNDYVDKSRDGYDSYTLKFNTAFGNEPSFFDDFEAFDHNKWSGGEEGWEYRSYKGGFVDNGDMVLRMTVDEPRHVVTTAKSFQQTYGCFSAHMKFPGYKNSPCACNCAFWLCSNVLTPEKIMFNRNPESDASFGKDHAGEIDIIEYSPAFGDFGTATFHYHGWGSYHIQRGKGEIPMHSIREGYHTVSLVWEPDALYWYYDGRLTHVYKGDGIIGAGKERGGDMVVLLQACMHMNLKKEDKGDKSWVGRTLMQDFPMEFRTDWVKVHALKK